MNYKNDYSISKQGVHMIWFVVLVTLFGCQNVFRTYHYQDDNAAEEVAEEIFKHYTGVDVDFTPDSKEGGKHDDK